MSDVIERISAGLNEYGLAFSAKPIVIGGMAMEFYGMRKAGADIDLVMCDADYRVLADRYPDKRKDIWGDLGVVIGPFEIWRSISLLDYDFLGQNASDQGAVKVVSLDRLLLMRVCAMGVQKYMDDLKLLEQYYYANYRNVEFSRDAGRHMPAYVSSGGTIWGGKYESEM